MSWRIGLSLSRRKTEPLGACVEAFPVVGLLTRCELAAAGAQTRSGGSEAPG